MPVTEITYGDEWQKAIPEIANAISQTIAYKMQAPDRARELAQQIALQNPELIRPENDAALRTLMGKHYNEKGVQQARIALQKLTQQGMQLPTTALSITDLVNPNATPAEKVPGALPSPDSASGYQFSDAFQALTEGRLAALRKPSIEETATKAQTKLTTAQAENIPKELAYNERKLRLDDANQKALIAIQTDRNAVDRERMVLDKTIADNNNATQTNIAAVRERIATAEAAVAKFAAGTEQQRMALENARKEKLDYIKLLRESMDRHWGYIEKMAETGRKADSPEVRGLMTNIAEMAGELAQTGDAEGVRNAIAMIAAASGKDVAIFKMMAAPIMAKAPGDLTQSYYQQMILSMQHEGAGSNNMLLKKPDTSDLNIVNETGLGTATHTPGYTFFRR